MASGSTTTSMSSSRTPTRLTSSTPPIPSSSSLRFLAIVVSVRSETSPARFSTSIGSNRVIFTSLTVGSSDSPGNFASAMSTFSRTSCRALSVSMPASNSICTLAPPSKASAIISLMPSIERSSCSMGRTSKRSASSGEIPMCSM